LYIRSFSIFSMHRIKELDFLRGIAILLVLLRHVNLSAFTTQIGWIGVDLFFVLSGYLVSGLLFFEYKKTGHVQPLRFLIRRGFKIYPLFYTVLFFYCIYFLLKGIPLTVEKILPEIFFFQNYRPGIIGISWSLAIEEHFYILLATSIFFLYRIRGIGKSKFLPLGCIIIAFACLILRTINCSVNEFSVYTHLFPTHLRIDALAFGVLLSWYKNLSPEKFDYFFKKHTILLLCILPVLFLPVFIWPVENLFVNTAGLTLLYLGFGIILSLVIAHSGIVERTGKHLYLTWPVNFIAWTGVYSYAIYLIHSKAGPIISNWIHVHFLTGWPWWIFIILNLAANIIAGYCLTLLIERPFLRLREKNQL